MMHALVYIKAGHVEQYLYAYMDLTSNQISYTEASTEASYIAFKKQA